MSVLGTHERVAVFRGGTTPTRQRSMEHGAVVLDVLGTHRRYTPLDVAVTNSGEWLFEGKVVQPAAFLAHVDTAYNAILGQYGEDGQLARILNRFGIPHQSASPYSALTTWRKDLALTNLQLAGINTPKRLVVHATSQSDLHALAERVRELFGPHYIVKPLSGTQRTSVYKVDNAAQLPAAISKVLSEHASCVVEEYIDGQSVTLTIAPGVRNQALYHTPVMRWQHQFGDDGLLMPAEALELSALSHSEKAQVATVAQAAYKALDLNGVVRTDLQVTQKGDIYFIENNTVSPLSPDAAMTQTLAAVGVTPEECVVTELTLARA